MIDPALSQNLPRLEREVLELAESMSRTPSHVTDELMASLRGQIGEEALVELTAAIATENFSARFNHAFGVSSNHLDTGDST